MVISTTTDRCARVCCLWVGEYLIGVGGETHYVGGGGGRGLGGGEGGGSSSSNRGRGKSRI